MKKILIITSTVLLVLLLFSCAPSGENGGETPDNPTPTLTSISPTSTVAHMPTFTLTATGTNFISSSSIVFDGTVKSTTYVSPTELTCQIDPDDIVTGSSAVSTGIHLSTAAETVPVLVRNPGPGGGDSDTLDFTINSDHTFYVANNISHTTGESWCPDIAVDSNGNINVVWQENSSTNWEIYFSRSSDNGSSWTPALNISNNSGRSLLPDIAIDSSGNLNVVWGDNTSGNYEIYFKRSTDGGTSWSSALNISNNLGKSENTAITADDTGNLYAAWEDDTSGNWEIYFSRSTDNGISWSPAVNVSNTLMDSEFPDLAVDSSGGINVCWDDEVTGSDEIFFKRSTDNGTSWSTAVNISNAEDNSRFPVISLDGTGNTYVFWGERRYDIPGDPTSMYFAICFTRSADNGSSWTDPKTTFTPSYNFVGYDFTADSAGNINLIWGDYDYSLSNWEIYFSRSIDSGGNWISGVNISNSTGDAESLAIAVDTAGNIHVVFEDDTSGNYDIYYTGSTR